MSAAWRVWAVAGGLSLLAHGGVFAFLKADDPFQEERSAGAPTAVWGQPGTMIDELQPSAPMTGAIEPTEQQDEAETRTESETESLKPVEQAQATETAPTETLEVTPAPVTEATPVETPAEERTPLTPLAEEGAVALPEVSPEEIEPEKETETLTAKEPAPAPPKKKAPRQQRAASGTSGERAGSSGRRTDTAGRADISSYRGRVLSHLRRYQRYPAEAERAGIHGTASVTFVIGANGAVRSVRLARSSGSGVLDREALAMVRRASPFPPFPSNLRSSSMAFNVPVAFARRR